MLKNYLVSAWRQLRKNKLYATINLLGLSVGLAIYLFSTLLADYENSHDEFYEASDRIFTVGSLFSPAANIGVAESDGIYTAFGPLIEAEIEQVEAVARTVGREYLLSIEDDHYYEKIRFADPEILQIFDFIYLEGDARALADPTGVLLTRDMAVKFFGDKPALGQVITLDHKHSLHVTAVIDNLPPNTHLRSSIFDSGAFNVVAPLEALNNVAGYDLAGNFGNLSSGNFTYLLMPASTSRDWLQVQVDGVFERHFPDPEHLVVMGLKVRPLVETNTILWDAVGMPIIQTIGVLGLLVLVVAIVNYTNLATAQSLGRSREIGLRKTMGAGRRQLITQFMVESLCVAVISMLIALAVIEIVVPLFNSATDKGLRIDYLDILPWLLATTLVVGLVAGAYPAYLITQASPIDAFRDGGGKGVKGGLFRSLMLGLQFSITIFMVAMVLVMFLQNKKIEQSAEIYPKSEVITLSRLGPEGIRERLDTLRNELMKIPGVQQVSYTSQLPFEQSNSGIGTSLEPADEDLGFIMSQILIDENFLSTFDMGLINGRGPSREISADTMKQDVLAANVVINETGLRRLGFSSAEEALGSVFYQIRREEEPRTLTIIGVLPDQNYMGFHNQIKPTIFYRTEEGLSYGAIRVEGVAMSRALSEVEAVWDQVIPDYPIQSAILDEEFNEMLRLYMGLTYVLSGFGVVALILSLIGLFGLAAFMAAGRTKEIGVRKVMGARMSQIVSLLIWQFSRPVLWALLVALPLAYFASNTYLTFFADRITFTAPIVAIAGMIGVLFAWGVVAIHAVRVARANPIQALRYE